MCNCMSQARSSGLVLTLFIFGFSFFFPACTSHCLIRDRALCQHCWVECVCVPIIVCVCAHFTPVSYSLISLSYYLSVCPQSITPLSPRLPFGVSHAEGYSAVSPRPAQRGISPPFNIGWIVMFINTIKIIVIGNWAKRCSQIDSNSLAETGGALRLFLQAAAACVTLRWGKQISSFVLESFFAILQITGVKIALIHAFIPHGDAIHFHQTSSPKQLARGWDVLRSVLFFVFCFLPQFQPFCI